MIFFITFLRALAACLITNAHYTDIYPTDLIANGGLIGDVLFFAVSGYCLYNVRYPLSAEGFARWYGRRIWRVYPPVVIMTAIYMLLGKYSLEEHGLFWWYVYPTYYHFVASIIVLYVPFFFIMKIERLRTRIPQLMGLIACVWLVVYVTVYDRSTYHIDTVREPMIRFLFMESMLLGAWFRQNDERLRNRFSMAMPMASTFVFVLYFASKLGFARGIIPSTYQCVNQIVIFVLLTLLFRTFCGLDAQLERMPQPAHRAVELISSITLEIYVVQYVLIAQMRTSGIAFPLNWLLLTASILITAYLLHRVCGALYAATDRALAPKAAS